MDKLNEHNLFNNGFNSWNKLTCDYFNGNKYNFKFWDERYLKIDEYYKNGYRVEISDTILVFNFFRKNMETHINRATVFILWCTKPKFKIKRLWI